MAKAFGLAHESPSTRAAFSKCVSKALVRKGATLIEVSCSATASEAARMRITNASTTALAKEFR
jgi:2-succinyl-5-enolpyruvyl-6-hydroxy-3-cyclohexene-1-carboxylate synthase